METYVIQKAQDALWDVCKDGDRDTRIRSAANRFIGVTSEHYLSGCSLETQAALLALRDRSDSEHTDQTMWKVMVAIQNIFEDAGRQDIRLGMERLRS